MRPWDLLLGVAAILVVIASFAIDWRLGCFVLAAALGGAWYWLEDVPGPDDREG